MNAVLLACSSLTKDVEAAQERMHTSHPVIWLERKYHAAPKEMRRQIQKTLDSLDQSVDTVLVAMGFCGGSWGDLTARQRIVIPCVDDCITLLLHTDDRKASNLKQKGHFYFRELDAGNISLESMENAFAKAMENPRAGRFSTTGLIRLPISISSTPEPMTAIPPPICARCSGMLL